MYLIGIDEVGRGPIAGPVAVGAFALMDTEALKRFRGVKESKQLPHAERVKWLQRIDEEKVKNRIDYAVTMVSEKIIDSRGLSFAIRFALKTSLKKLGLKPSECTVLLDGGLRAPKTYKNQKTIIKGDEKETVIALASIAAKVTRDLKMIELKKKYNNFSFDTHKGYGTPEHYAEIRKFGLTPLHRRSFLKRLS
jgi:ribonuclease HII